MFKRLLTTTLIGATLAAGSIFSMGAVATAASATTCPGGSFPSYVEGKPASAVPGMTGLAVWHDTWGWKLRASEAGPDLAVFKGRIQTDGVIVAVARHTEGGDIVASVGRHNVWFKFNNYGGVDGLNFVVRCASYIKIGTAMDGSALPTNEIVIGAADTNPSANPFSLVKS